MEASNAKERAVTGAGIGPRGITKACVAPHIVKIAAANLISSFPDKTQKDEWKSGDCSLVREVDTETQSIGTIHFFLSKDGI